jgi:hypothetical protein
MCYNRHVTTLDSNINVFIIFLLILLFVQIVGGFFFTVLSIWFRPMVFWYKSQWLSSTVFHTSHLTALRILLHTPVLKQQRKYFLTSYNGIACNGTTVYCFFFPMARQPLEGLGRLIFRGFTITLRHTTLGRTPLDEWPTRRRDYLTTHNTHKRQTSMP